jgi:hypothetical protein
MNEVRAMSKGNPRNHSGRGIVNQKKLRSRTMRGMNQRRQSKKSILQEVGNVEV